MNGIDISVIIPVKNGQRYLKSVLEAVFSQEINAKFEVIIVDSGSTDKTLNIIMQYQLTHYRIRETEFNHGLTRNFAISKSQGKYIILMNSDAIPYNNRWMERLVSNLECDQRAAGVYSRQVPHKESHPLTQVRVNRFFTSSKTRRESQIDKIDDYEKLSPREKHRFCNFDNVSSCIRRDVWDKIPFPKTDFAEDLEWSESVLRAGHKIIYEPDSIVYHSHDFSIFDWYKKNRVNFNKLASLFGLNNINNIYRLLAFFFIYTFRDIYFLYKDKRSFTAILSNIHLIPLYSFSGALGQYIGAKEAFHFK